MTRAYSGDVACIYGCNYIGGVASEQTREMSIKTESVLLVTINTKKDIFEDIFLHNHNNIKDLFRVKLLTESLFPSAFNTKSSLLFAILFVIHTMRDNHHIRTIYISVHGTV